MHLIKKTLLLTSTTDAFNHQTPLPTDAFNHQTPLLPNRIPLINSLLPSDIKVIAALGDSITAACFATPSPYPIENRGVSFSIGGDRNYTTLPNLFKKYNKSIYGQSYGDHVVDICYGVFCPPVVFLEDHLNMARTGSMVMNLDGQVEMLLRSILVNKKKIKKTDFKLITILIGANDQCLACTKLALTESMYRKYLTRVLGRIKEAVPNSVVLISSMFRVSQVYGLSVDDEVCRARRNLGFVFECLCAFGEGVDGIRDRLMMDEMASWMNKVTLDIVSKFQKSDDFALIFDPTFQTLDLGLWKDDVGEMISRFDCFHPTWKTHALLAGVLWNGLFKTREERERTRIFPDEELVLFEPNSTSYINTN